MTINPDSPEFEEFDRRMKAVMDSMSSKEMTDMICVLLDFQMLMNQYVLEVDPDLFNRAKQYACDYVGPRFAHFEEIFRKARG